MFMSNAKIAKASRYNKESLEIHYKEKNIADVLNMTVEEALTFFKKIPAIKRKLANFIRRWFGLY